MDLFRFSIGTNGYIEKRIGMHKNHIYTFNSVIRGSRQRSKLPGDYVYPESYTIDVLAQTVFRDASTCRTKNKVDKINHVVKLNGQTVNILFVLFLSLP